MSLLPYLKQGDSSELSSESLKSSLERGGIKVNIKAEYALGNTIHIKLRILRV